LIIECEGCGTRFRLDDSKIKDRELKVKCSRCQHIFTVNRQGSRTSPDDASEEKEPVDTSPLQPEGPPAEESLLETAQPALGEEESAQEEPEDFGLEDFSFLGEEDNTEEPEAAARRSPSAVELDLEKEDKLPEWPVFGEEESGEGTSLDEQGHGLEGVTEGEAASSGLELELDLDKKGEEDEVKEGEGLTLEATLEETGFGFKKEEGSPAAEDAAEDREPSIHEEQGTGEDLGVEEEPGLDMDAGEEEEDEKEVEAVSIGEMPEEGLPPVESEESGTETPFQTPPDLYEEPEPLSAENGPGPSGKDEPGMEERQDEKGDFEGEEPTEEPEPASYIQAPPAEPQHDEPPTRKGLGRWLVIVLVFILLYGGGAAVYFSGAVGPARSVSAPSPLRIEKLSATFKDNVHIGRVLAIEARIRNFSEEPQEITMVRGVVYNGEGRIVAARRVSPGRILSSEELKTLTNEELLKHFGVVSGGTVPPKGTIPVMVVFTEVPKDMARAGVEVIRK